MEILKKIDWVGTFRSMRVGESFLVRAKQMKPVNVRILISRLRGEGYSFECTDAGLADSIRVTKTANKEQ